MGEVRPLGQLPYGVARGRPIPLQKPIAGSLLTAAQDGAEAPPLEVGRLTIARPDVRPVRLHARTSSILRPSTPRAAVGLE